MDGSRRDGEHQARARMSRAGDSQVLVVECWPLPRGVGGYVFGDAHSPLASPVPLAAPSLPLGPGTSCAVPGLSDAPERLE